MIAKEFETFLLGQEETFLTPADDKLMLQCLLVRRVVYNTKQNKYNAAALISIVPTANIQTPIY